MNSAVTFVRNDVVALLCIDNPPVNALPGPVIAGIAAAIDRFQADHSFAALQLHCEGRTFVAGGDISGFDDPGFSAAPFNAALARLEARDLPVAAVLHGTTLGGGLELALACHYRVCLPTAQFGFPEVKLGILPGSLGTQRLPRLVGHVLALDLISSGRSIAADAALKAGIVDAVREGPPLEAGLAYVQELLASGAAVRRLSERNVPAGSVPAGFFEQAMDESRHRKAFYPAARGIVEAVRAATELPFPEGEAVEARLFEQLRTSPQSRALRHPVFAERQAARIRRAESQEMRVDQRARFSPRPITNRSQLLPVPAFA